MPGRLKLAGLIVCLGLGLAAPAGAQIGDASSPNTAEITLPVGKSQVIELPAPYTDVMVADPKIADVMPLSTHSVYVVGKSMGSTALTIYGRGKQLIASANVVVSADIDSLKNRLNEVMPNEHRIAVRAANQSIVLSGTVGSPAAVQQAIALAETYAPTKVVNMLGVEGTQQVMLSVRFVEMEHTAAKDLQLNLQSASQSPGHSPAFAINTGDTINGNTNLLSSLFGTAAARISRGEGGLNVIFDALETKGLVKTLAEPNLTAMSGDTASFLAGGEFPIPVAQTIGTGGVPTITIEFKQFGVALGFTPTILSDGMINMVVTPEVSSIDPSISFNLGTIQVPGPQGPPRANHHRASRRRVLHHRRPAGRELQEPDQAASLRRRRASPGRAVPLERLPARRDRTGDRGHPASGDAAPRADHGTGGRVPAAVRLRTVPVRRPGGVGDPHSSGRSGADLRRPDQGRRRWAAWPCPLLEPHLLSRRVQ